LLEELKCRSTGVSPCVCTGVSCIVAQYYWTPNPEHHGGSGSKGSKRFHPGETGWLRRACVGPAWWMWCAPTGACGWKGVPAVLPSPSLNHPSHTHSHSLDHSLFLPSPHALCTPIQLESRVCVVWSIGSGGPPARPSEQSQQLGPLGCVLGGLVPFNCSGGSRSVCGVCVCVCVCEVRSLRECAISSWVSQ
jgi:hypothetical protein